jgi:hypothetical protein
VVCWHWLPTGQSAVLVQAASVQFGVLWAQCFAPSVLAMQLLQSEYCPGQSLVLVQACAQLPFLRQT